MTEYKTEHLESQIALLENERDFLKHEMTFFRDEVRSLKETIRFLGLDHALLPSNPNLEENRKVLRDAFIIGASLQIIRIQAEETPAVEDAWKKFIVMAKLHGFEELLGNVDADRT